MTTTTKSSATLAGSEFEYVPADVDPVTFEVIRHRLLAINEEQATALKAVSGSPIVTEADDYNTALYRAGGELAAMGRTVIYHAASMSEMVKHVIADCANNPGIEEGDSFVLNSPHKGALHAPDVGVLQPIFYEGKRIAWSGACAHQLDIGGLNHGGFMPQARDIFQEGILMPPVKLIAHSVIREDIWAFILGMSRLPAALGLNLKGMIAANRSGADGLHQLIERYGINTVLSVMDGLMDLSEAKLRARLRELPDGRFRAQSFLDHDGHENKLFRVSVTLTKMADRLEFDYTDCSPQTGGFVNCTRTGLLAGVYAGLLPILAYDLPWNEGAFRPVNIVSRPGTIVTAEPPAPCSAAPLGGIWLTEITATEALSKLMATTPDSIAEAQASPAGGVDMLNPSGIDQYGEYSGWIYLDQMHTGGGAYGQRDGLSPQGQRCITSCRVANVESMELISPMLWLRRRMVTDSAGPGRNRGGQSAGAAMILHDAYWLSMVVGGHGFQSPNARGLFGGYPGKCNRRRVLRGSDFFERARRGTVPIDLEDIEGDLVDQSAKTPEFTLQPGDIVEWTPQAGGGWGDPLERPPADVVIDINEYVVSQDVARKIYGVLLRGDGVFDSTATSVLRAEMRDARRAWPADSHLDDAPTDGGRARVVSLLGDRMAVVEIAAERFVQCECKTVFSRASENWKRFVGCHVALADELGPGVRLHEELEVRMYACLGCGRLLDVEVASRGSEPQFDIELL
jgi:N-methylhydantoinase B